MMNNQLPSALRRSLWPLLALGILLLLGSARCAYAQSGDVSITVSGIKGTSYGTLFRSSSSTVSYASINASEFEVVGKQNRQVRITVTPSSLTRGTNTLDHTIRLIDCAYSVDEGVTWTRFTTGALFQDLYFPTGTQNGYVSGTVRVRVGGIVTSTSTQQRGTYTGTITVSAAYR